MDPFRKRPLRTLALLLAWFSTGAGLLGAPEPETHSAVKDLNTPREFPAISSREQWRGRASEIREHILVSCGLWPMPARVPLNPHIFGKIERNGYSVEKVYIQTMPGFYLAGEVLDLDGPIGGYNFQVAWSTGWLAGTKSAEGSRRFAEA